MTLFVVDITVIPGVVYDVIAGITGSIKDSISQWTNEHTLRFKVVGEHKFYALAVSEEIAEGILDAVSKRVGPYVTIRSTPVRNYEEFAKNVLKVDPEVCISKREAFSVTNKKIFFCRMTVDHPGAKQEDLFGVWKTEATGGLTARSKGELDVRIFKIIGQRTIFVFWEADSADDMDNAFYELPLARSSISGSDFQCFDIAQVAPF